MPSKRKPATAEPNIPKELALRNVMRKSVRSTREWKIAMNQFAVLFGDRFKASRA